MNDHLIYDSYDVQIGSIGGKLYQHINDNDIHLSAEDREKLDSIKVGSSTAEDDTTIGYLQTELNNKANKDDIPTKVSQLENDLNFLTEIPDYYTTEEEVKLLIEELAGSGSSGGDTDLSDIQDQIDELTKLVNQYGLTIEQLRQLINQNTSDITNLEETVQNIKQQITNIDNRVTNIEQNGTPGTPGTGEYVLPVATGSRLGGVKIGSGINVTSDGTISVASSEPGEGSLTPGDIATLDERYLRKDTDDETTHSITVPELESNNFVSGMVGTGFYLGKTAPDNSDQQSHLEVDNLLVRNKAIFEELEIRKLSYVNGNLVLSAAGGIIEEVEDHGTYWRCYLKSDDGTTATTNTFQVNDLVRCETFDIKTGVYEGVSNKFYWRQIINVGSDDNDNYVDINKSNCASGSDEPQAGDTIVQFGNTTDSDRQNIITISATDTDSPSIKMYSQVRSYDLNDATLNTVISPGQVAFRTDLFRLITGTNYNRVCIDRGAYDSNTTYYYWDRVSYNGSLWLNVYQEGTTKGITPGDDSNYWMEQVSKGDKGDKGDQGDQGQPGPPGESGEAIDAGNGYVVYVNPPSVSADYTTQFDSDGHIQSFSISNITVIVSVYKDGKFVTDAVAYVDDDTDTDKIRIDAMLFGGKNILYSITPTMLNTTSQGNAQIVITQDLIGYTNEKIASALVHEGTTLYWPCTQLKLAVGVRLPASVSSDQINIVVPINLNIVGATSFWEVTADHWESRFALIEGGSELDDIIASISEIEQTAEQIKAFVGKYWDTGQTLETILDMQAGGLSMATVINKLRVAGINIFADDSGEPTGTVEIYGDKVTIKNEEGGDDILWVYDGKTYMGNTIIESGQIAGFNISGNSLTNEGFDNDATIVIRNDPNDTFVGIGGNVWPSSAANLRATARFENNNTSNSDITTNVAIYAEATGSQVGNFALKGTGNIAVAGMITGYTYNAQGTGLSSSVPAIDYTKGNIQTIRCMRADDYLLLPNITTIRSALGISNTEYFSVLLFLTTEASTQGFRLCGKGVLSTDNSNYPALYKGSSTSVDSIPVSPGDSVIVALTYNGNYHAVIMANQTT